MNPRLKALLNQKAALINEYNSFQQKTEWTEQDEARMAELPGLIEASDTAIEKQQADDEKVKRSATLLNGGLISPAAARQIIADTAADAADEAARRYRGKIVNFTGSREEASRKAYRFGMWILATMGKPGPKAYCQAHGIVLEYASQSGAINAAQHVEGINEVGGYLVPPEFDNDLIILREQYGLFRQFARISNMTSDVKKRRRRTGGLTAFFTGETEAATKSKMGWDMVELVAKDVMVLTYESYDLNEDSVISMGDTLAGEIAYAYAKLEDDCGFNGDGTSAYGRIVGCRQKLYDTYGAAGGVGLKVASGNSYSEITLPDFNAVLGLLPQYADRPDTGWYCHKSFYHNVMEKLMLAAGGVTAAEVAAGRRTLIFMGYPVHISQVLPKVEANSQVCCLFGNMRLAVDFGDRRQTTIMFSEHAAFETNEIGIRGTQRFDINVHDVGNATDAGPLVGLETAAA